MKRILSSRASRALYTRHSALPTALSLATIATFSMFTLCLMFPSSSYADESADHAAATAEPAISTNTGALPDYESDWPGFAKGLQGSVVTSTTATSAASLTWSYSYIDEGALWASASDPLLINGDVYLVANDTLRMIDGDTGKLTSSVPTGSTFSYICRPVYTDGLVIVPADDGSLTAFAADSLAEVWKSVALPASDNGSYQALCPLLVSNGFIYTGFSVPDGAYNGCVEGTLVCISVADGQTRWTKTYDSSSTGQAEGYYWTGPASTSSGDIVIGNDAGKVSLVDGATGQELSSVLLDARCRSSVMYAKTTDTGVQVYLVTDYAGSLYRIELADETLSIAGKVSFAASSTSTPTCYASRAYVCGCNADGNGTLSIIDYETMTVDTTIVAGKGAAQSTPLVSIQGNDEYAYFTCNAVPGGVYVYHYGDDAASLLFEPTGDMQNYCMSSVIADSQGILYYTNDSGTLFALRNCGWVQTDKGKKYVYEDGTYAKGFVADIDGDAYCFDEDSGIMLTGFRKFDKNTGSLAGSNAEPGSYEVRYFYQEGPMARGLVSVNGYNRYFDEDTGFRHIGFLRDKDDKVYYFKLVTGIQAFGWEKIYGSWRYFKSDTGQRMYGFQRIYGQYYLFDSYAGVRQTGWHMVNGKSRYFKSDTGVMMTGTVKIYGVWYTFDKDGALIG